MNKDDFDIKMKYLEKTQSKFVGLVFTSFRSNKLHVDIYEDEDYKLVANLDDVHLYTIIDGATLEEVVQEFRYVRSKYMKRQMNKIEEAK